MLRRFALFTMLASFFGCAAKPVVGCGCDCGHCGPKCCVKCDDNSCVQDEHNKCCDKCTCCK